MDDDTNNQLYFAFLEFIVINSCSLFVSRIKSFLMLKFKLGSIFIKVPPAPPPTCTILFGFSWCANRYITIYITISYNNFHYQVVVTNGDIYITISYNNLIMKVGFIISDQIINRYQSI